MGRFEDTAICVGIFYLVLLFVAISAAIFASSAAQSYAMYEVKPLFCDMTIYSNSTWKVSDGWELLPTQGFCPLSKRTTIKAAGAKSLTASYKYDECWAFKKDKYKWHDLDVANAESEDQVSSSFRPQVNMWAASGRLSQAATFFIWAAFVSFIVAFIGRKWNAARYLVYLPYVCLGICWTLWLGAIATIRGTSYLSTDAWAASFFKSCTVIVARRPAFVLGGYVVISVGFFLGLFFSMFVYYLLRDVIHDALTNPQKNRKEKEMFHISETFENREKSLLDFHAALLEHTYYVCSPIWHEDEIPEQDVEMMIEADRDIAEVPEGDVISLHIVHLSTSQIYDVTTLSTAKVSELREIVLIKINEGRGIPGNGLPLYTSNQLSFQYNGMALPPAIRLHQAGVTKESRLILFLAGSAADTVKIM